MPSVEVAGLRIAYTQVGSGPPVILLHGVLADGRVWADTAARLADTYTVVAWDAPGCGDSSDHPPGFRMAEHAATLVDFADALDLDRPHLIGHSWGAVLALAAFQHRPSFPRSLVLANGYAGWAGSLPPSTVRERLAAALTGLESMTSDGVVDAWLPTLFSSTADPAVVDRLAAIMRDLRPATAGEALRAVAEADFSDLLPTIDVPTLVVHAELDARAQLQVAEGLAAAIQSARLAVLPGIGHMSYLGNLSLMFDAVAWHRARDDLREGQWWAAWPYDDPSIDQWLGRRSRSDVLRDLEFYERRYRWVVDHQAGWPAIVAFVRAHPATDQAEWLIEEVVLSDGPAYIDRIESLARTDQAIRDTVESMHLGGFAGPEIDRLERLQDEFSREG